MMKKKICKFEVNVTSPGGDIWVYVSRESDKPSDLEWRWRWYHLFDHNADKARRKRFMLRAQRAQVALFERGA